VREHPEHGQKQYEIIRSGGHGCPKENCFGEIGRAHQHRGQNQEVEHEIRTFEASAEINKSRDEQEIHNSQKDREKNKLVQRRSLCFQIIIGQKSIKQDKNPDQNQDKSGFGQKDVGNVHQDQTQEKDRSKNDPEIIYPIDAIKDLCFGVSGMHFAQ
jgi:hypothetical protein